jgi:hypothetical protein
MRRHHETLDRRGLEQVGFVVLDEQPGKHLVLGLTGKFWTPGGHIERVAANAFRDFASPGFAQATWGFELSGSDGAVHVTTETRTRCTDDASRRSFLRYWRFIGPFSALIRRALLRSMSRRAMASA